MKLRIGVVGAMLLVTLAITGFAAAGSDGGDAADGATDLPIKQESFVGLTISDATALAETQDQPWRIRREDTTDFVLTDDLVPGRVTFDVDDGTVTSAHIEHPNTDPPDAPPPEDQAGAELVVAGLLRLLTVDNSFGGADVFTDIRVDRTLGSDGTELAPLALELASSTLSRLGLVRFVNDADAEIDALFDTSPSGVAVVAVERIELLDDRAELELRLWCGSLCGVFLTYEAVSVAGGWEITGTTGTTGPIAMS